ncbi:MAG: quinolinate synthase NadA [Alphaproteobacteria bacterium]|nr:quinolinate synthase NadA [Alphaproteobacteria bacterium]
MNNNSCLQTDFSDFILPYTDEVKSAVEHLYKNVERVVTKDAWEKYAPYIYEINKLKAEKNAIIIAHNYMTPEIFRCVADYVGDSLAMAFDARDTDADIVVVCGVSFMAETSKLLSPEKIVLIPDTSAGCSLSESIVPEDIAYLRREYPGVPIVTYANTTIAVKAVSDICCTSGNIINVIKSLNTDKVICTPDRLLAAYAASQLPDIEIIPFPGECEVHKEFSAQDIKEFRYQYPDIVILAHPECRMEVLNVADYIGSTAGMAQYIKDNQPKTAALITECSMGDNLATENPNVTFINSCRKCPHMQLITLPKVLNSLQNMEHEITAEKDISDKAREVVKKMLAVPRG